MPVKCSPADRDHIHTHGQGMLAHSCSNKAAASKHHNAMYSAAASRSCYPRRRGGPCICPIRVWGTVICSAAEGHHCGATGEEPVCEWEGARE
jgi:hypothetical protein